MNNKIMENGVAVIGISCRFPEAKNVTEYWNNLKNGVESVKQFSEEELLEAGVPLKFIKNPNYVKACGAIEDVDLFDHRFFDYSPKEAQNIDPQQRILLECAWECFEDAGYVPQELEDRVGVYAGMRSSSYIYNSGKIGTAMHFQELIGSDKDYIASRISYKLNLKGPSVVVQTACSTSLVTVHMACESLRSGECDMALAGGAAISIPYKQGYFYQKDMIFSPDGHCRAFDKDAQGTVGGNGVGIVLLKPLDKAIADQDHIYAIIRGSAINNDGQSKAGYTAPSIAGQASVVAEAVAMAEADFDEIGYIETHGTGTSLGDPIEIQALDRVFSNCNGDNKCAIGSVKPNIGHLDTAAGIASFIKAILSVYHGEIPPSINYSAPNPKIDFSESHFYVNSDLKKWNTEKIRIAGVSSFGIGGTNAHVVLQQPEQEKETNTCNVGNQGPYLFVLSALNELSLNKMAEKMKDYFSNCSNSLEDVSYTLGKGRKHFPVRVAWLASTYFESVEKLEAFLNHEQIEGLFLATSTNPDLKEGEIDSKAEKLILMAQDYVTGQEINWNQLFEKKNYSRVSLPTYYFDKVRHWKENTEEQNSQKQDKNIEEVLSSVNFEDLSLKCHKKQYITDYKLLEKWVAVEIMDTLKELGAFLEEDERMPLEGFFFQTAILPKYSMFLKWILNMLSEQGIVGREEDEFYRIENNLIAPDILKQLEKSDFFDGKLKILEKIKSYLNKMGEFLCSTDLVTNEEYKKLAYEIQTELDSDAFAYLAPDKLAITEVLQKIAKNIADDCILDIFEVTSTAKTYVEQCKEYFNNFRVNFTVQVFDSDLFNSLRDKYHGAENIEVYMNAPTDYTNLVKKHVDILIFNRALHNLPDLGNAFEEIQKLATSQGIIIIQENNEKDLLQTLLSGPWIQNIETKNRGEFSPFPVNEYFVEALDGMGYKNLLLTKSPTNREYTAIAIAPAERENGEIKAFSRTENEIEKYGITTCSNHPELGVKYSFVYPIYENLLSGFDIPADYFVLKHNIVPLSFFVTTIKKISEDMFENSKVTISEVSVFEPLKLEDSEKVILQMVVNEKHRSEFSISIFSRSKDNISDEEWHLHCKATVKTVNDIALKPFLSKPSEISVEDRKEIEANQIYSVLEEKGIGYKNTMKILESISIGKTKAKGKTLFVDFKMKDIIEATIQTAFMLIQDKNQDLADNGVIYFPTEIEHIEISDSLDKMSCEIICTKREDQKGNQKNVLIDGEIFDSNHTIIGHILGIMFVSYSEEEINKNIQYTNHDQEQSSAQLEVKNEHGILHKLKNASEQEKVEMLQNYLIHTFANILRMDPKEISLNEDFIQMGLDSLMFLELNQLLLRDLNVSLTAQEVFETPYITALIERLQQVIFTLQEDQIKINNPVDAIGGEIIPDLKNKYEPFELTNVQYAYWIGRSGILDLGEVSCHFYFEVDRPELDISAFNTAWNKVVNRHDMLRSIILPEGLQCILPEVPYYEVSVNDLRDISKQDIEVKLEELRYEKSHQVISSDIWPLFDISVCLLPDKVRILFSIELLNADVMSIQIIFEEVGKFLKDPGLELEPLQLSFRDYIKAEKKLQKTKIYDQSKQYWLNKIETMPDAPDLPLVKGMKEAVNQRFTSLVKHIDKECWTKLKQKAAKRGITPSGILLAAYADVLGLWSKNNEFVLSLAQFNRIPYHPEVYSILGDFTSIMIMDMHPNKGNSFLERAKNTQKDLWANLEYRYFDGVQVLREMARGKRSGKEALVPVVFTSILGMGEESEELYPWAVLGEVGYFVSQTPQVWLDNQVSESRGELIISWDVIEELFPDGMLQDMLDTYENILIDLAEDEEAWERNWKPQLPERQLQLIAQRGLETNSLPSGLLQTEFLAQIEKHPEKSAVVSEERTVSYEELRNISNNLAYKIRRIGVVPNDIVAIISPKGWEQVAGVMGILMSGAAYLPIDSSLPKERIQLLLEQSKAKAIVVHPGCKKRIQVSEDLETISIEYNALMETKSETIQQINQSSDMAYIIYTSGSTGIPKGVVINHLGALNTITDMNQRFEIEEQDVFLGLSALNFDLSVYDIFGALSKGGTLVIPSEKSAKDPSHWWELINKYQVTVWNSVPILMEMLLETPHVNENDKLRLVLLSGDWIPVSLPDKIVKEFENAKRISLGGATEASIWSVMYPITKVNPSWTSIPYGKAMKNQTISVRKKNMDFCPIGMEGELYIGGVGLAQGYLNEPEKTQNSFIEDPVTEEKLYRTGDYGRYMPDGNIEFLGRADSQVKIHGYRVELGEIESVLQQHPAVKEAVVETVADGNSTKLQAYLVLKENADEKFYLHEKCDRDKIQSDREKMIEIGRTNTLNVPDSAINDYPKYWEFMESIADAIIFTALYDMKVFHNIQDTYKMEELITTCKIDPMHQAIFEKWIETLVDRKILSFNEHKFSLSRPIKEVMLSDELINKIPKESYWRKTAEKLLKYFQEIRAIYPSILRGQIDPRELLLDEDAPITAKAMEQFDSLEERVKEIIVQFVNQGIQNAGAQTLIMELGSLAGNIADSVVLDMDQQRCKYMYTHISSVFLDDVKKEIQIPDAIEYKLFNFNKEPAVQEFENHIADVIVAPNTLHRARNLSKTLKYLKSLLKAGGIFILYEETKNNPIQLVTVGLFEKGFSEFVDERKETFESLLSREHWIKELTEAGLHVVGCYPDNADKVSIFGHSIFIVQGPDHVFDFNRDNMRDYLKNKLPEYMVPSNYMCLESLPITENGKVDRSLLQNYINKHMAYTKADYCRPETDLEKQVCKLWQDVLGTQNDNMNDDFISLGGDSLQAVQLVNVIKNTFDLSFPLNKMFNNVTMKTIVSFIESNK